MSATSKAYEQMRALMHKIADQRKQASRKAKRQAQGAAHFAGLEQLEQRQLMDATLSLPGNMVEGGPQFAQANVNVNLNQAMVYDADNTANQVQVTFDKAANEYVFRPGDNETITLDASIIPIATGGGANGVEARVDAAGLANLGITELNMNMFDGDDTLYMQPDLTLETFVDAGQGNDRLLVNLRGVSGADVPANQDMGTITAHSHQDFNYMATEKVITSDSYENNDTIATASILGSNTAIVVNNLSIDTTMVDNFIGDEDYYQLTAHSTGYLVINAYFNNDMGDIDMQLLDTDGNIIKVATSKLSDNEQIVVPVVAQENYILYVYGFDGATNVYDLEIENYTVPIPTGVLLDANSDTGMSDSDQVTSNTSVDLIVSVDLSDIANQGIDVLDSTTIFGNDGVYVKVLKDGKFLGFADPMPGSNNTLFSVTTFPGWLSEGENVITAEVVVVDGQTVQEAGSTEMSPPLVLTLDTIAPNAASATLAMNASSNSGILGDLITNINAPAFDGVGEAGAKIRIYANGELVGQSVINSDESNGNASDGLGIWEITVEPLADGDYTMTIVLEDLAGNITNSSATLNVTVDTTLPQRPTIDLINVDDTGSSDLDNVTNLPSVMVRVSAQAGSNVVIKNGELVIDSFVMPVTVDGFTSRTLVLAQGTHPLSSEAFDAANNRSMQSEELLMTVDTTSPDAGSVTMALLSASDSGIVGDGITSVAQPAFDGVAEANAIVRLYANGELVGQTVAGSDASNGNAADGLGVWEITSEPLVDGSYVMSLQVEDLAGNISTIDGQAGQTAINISIDTATPQRPTIDLVDASDTGASDLDNVVNITTLDFTVAAEAGSSVVIKDGTLVIDSFTMPTTANGYTTRTLQLAQGTHLLSSQATDASGNLSSQSEELTVTVDTTAPDASLATLMLNDASNSGVIGDTLTSTNAPALHGIVEANATVRLYANGELVGQTVANSDESNGNAADGLGTWEITSEPLVDGSYTMSIVIEDLAGNVTVGLTTLDITVDSLAPSRPTIDLLDVDDTGLSDRDNLTSLNTLRFSISAEAGSQVQILDGELVIDSFTMPAVATGLTIRTLVLVEGSHPLSVQALDASNNRSMQSMELLIAVDNTAPVVPTLVLQDGSDTQPLGDGITSVSTPVFDGLGEAGSMIQLFANGESVGQGMAGTDASNGDASDNLGTWDIASSFLADNNYTFTAQAQDAAGNLSLVSQGQMLTIVQDYGFDIDPITGVITYLGEDGIADIVTISLNEAGDTVIIDWEQPSLGLSGSLSAVKADTPAIIVKTLGGDDLLITDNTNGIIDLTDGITYDGGAGYDGLNLIGSTMVSSTYSAGPAHGAGRVVHEDASNNVQLVQFDGLEPVIDITSGDLTVEATAGSNMITYSTGPNSGSALVNSLETGQIAIDEFEAIEFGNKTSLTLLALAGDDTINMNNQLLPSQVMNITLDGGVGNDLILGSASNDTIIGGDGNDNAQGNDGDDTFIQGNGNDIYDGGSGNNTLMVTATDNADTVMLTNNTLDINSQSNSFANIANMNIDTAGGNDDIQIDSSDVAGFPAMIDILSGQGDDTIYVSQGNQAPASILNIDAGTGDNDDVTVQGMTGDNNFVVNTLNGATSPNQAIFGQSTTNVTGQENLRVLEGTRLDHRFTRTVEQNKFRFTDADGNRVVASMAGPGTIDIFRDVTLSKAADIYSIVATGTHQSKSSLKIKVKKQLGTDNETSIGTITGTGMRSLIAKNSDLTGSINLTDTLRKLKLDDVDGDITIAGESGRKMTFIADRVGTVNFTTENILRNMKVTSWSAGTIQASLFGNILAREGLVADFINTRTNRREFGMKKLVSKGPLVTNITADRVGSIIVKNGDAQINLNVTVDDITLNGRVAIQQLKIIGGNLIDSVINMQDDTMIKKLIVRSAKGIGGSIVGTLDINGIVGITQIADQSGATIMVNGLPAQL